MFMISILKAYMLAVVLLTPAIDLVELVRKNRQFKNLNVFYSLHTVTVIISISFSVD